MPEAVIVATWQLLRDSARVGCESTARWAGPSHQLSASAQVVTTVLVPAQRIGPRRFDVPHASTRAMGDALGLAGLANLAQLHTHPGRWVGHSDWDDARAYSTRDGALSIVWPHYGRRLLESCAWGVHECRSREWVQLTTAEAAARVVVVPSIVDLRLTHEILDDEDDGDDDSSVGNVRDGTGRTDVRGARADVRRGQEEA